MVGYGDVGGGFAVGHQTPFHNGNLISRISVFAWFCLHLVHVNECQNAPAQMRCSVGKVKVYSMGPPDFKLVHSCQCLVRYIYDGKKWGTTFRQLGFRPQI